MSKRMGLESCYCYKTDNKFVEPYNSKVNLTRYISFYKKGRHNDRECLVQNILLQARGTIVDFIVSNKSKISALFPKVQLWLQILR